ncbi:carboxypeptidase regulatory-like domain-containing protein [Elizabethkingia miricola]|uniref:carboxypeptidase regulatory-like domain-containing protein n=1 Tax=Elizabethkingia miricola TaxID=172045 RepID=UPI000B359F6D|nr:carboxypeptidase regulatory-like domain-containing protein [Elizabethkingia miricola]NHQ65486.1 TonB-dependent receptor [Elizabethkingia miricola]NHQ69181.1 TonB-dependent receptor [Elizabethkingia miricola]NHQ76319.1 TonB-dependent receptor [Elizabethkingia miricola]PSL90393.1 peptidase [Elizabethkingia miricola]QHQ86811.1 TonB-dependent receptor [Elizabethkingia miricola]
MIKKLSLLSLFTLLPASFYYAQTTAFAYIKDTAGKPVESADVSMKGSSYSVTADKIGYFQFVGLKPGHYQITVSKPPFESQIVEFDVEEGKKRQDLGVIKLSTNFNDIDQGFTILDDSDQSDELNNQSTVGLLQSSRDVFSSIAAFDLGFYWFRPRGIDSRLGENMINGVSTARPDTGMVDFSTWGGLNEITRYPEIALNHSPSEYGFGGVGSVFYKNTKASDYRKGSQLTYSLTNRNYNNRLSYRFSSGMNKKGWAFTGMIARRWAQEGIQDGTFYDAISGYLGVEKKINDKHTVTLNAIGSDYRRSTSSPNTQEVYDYRGVHYNAYWGWQDGRKRSERVKTGFMPMIQLTDYWKINKKSDLWTTVSYQFGKEKSSRLDWYKANNPSPIYYRNLPSYWENLDKPSLSQQENLALTKDWWTNNVQDHTQINWNSLYNANLNGPVGENGRRAFYFLENDVKNNKIWNVSTHYTNNLTDRMKLVLNLTYQNYYSEQYREIKDLLGADYALNMDPFAKTARGGSFNTLDPNVNKKVGDKFGYDYIYRRQDINFNAGLKFSTPRIDGFVSALVGYSTNNREGLFQHYLYKDSYGKGADQNFWNFGLKGQLTYKLNGRMFLMYNGAYYSQAPFLNDIFINARNSNAVSPNIQSTIINANDLSYIISAPSFKLRLTGYLINTMNDTNVQRYFANGISFNTLDDAGQEIQGDNQAMVTQVLSNVNTRNMGVELGIQVKITPTLTASGLASIGQYTYTNNPKLYFASDAMGVFYDYNKQGELVRSEYKDLGESYLKDYKVGGTPQQAFSVGLRYSSPKYWWISGNWNYLRDGYIDPSPATRTNAFIYNPNTPGVPYDDVNEMELRRVLKQVQLPDAFFFNASAGKSWVIGKYYFVISATVNNILNNKKYITGGFEQTRYINYKDYVADFDRNTSNFAPKYFYSQGRSYFFNVQFRF